MSPSNLRGHAVETGLIGFVHHSTAALISLLIWIGIDPVFRLEPVWVSGLGGWGVGGVKMARGNQGIQCGHFHF